MGASGMPEVNGGRVVVVVVFSAGRPTAGRSPQTLGAIGSRGPRPPRPRRLAAASSLGVSSRRCGVVCPPGRSISASRAPACLALLDIRGRAPPGTRGRRTAGSLGSGGGRSCAGSCCEAPVPRSQLMYIDGVLPFLGENRLRLPASHDPPE